MCVCCLLFWAAERIAILIAIYLLNSFFTKNSSAVLVICMPVFIVHFVYFTFFFLLQYIFLLHRDEFTSFCVQTGLSVNTNKTSDNKNFSLEQYVIGENPSVMSISFFPNTAFSRTVCFCDEMVEFGQ